MVAGKQHKVKVSLWHFSPVPQTPDMVCAAALLL
jgi:hypothetical protein